MPKTIYIPRYAKFSGINITWTPSTRSLYISGWYDTIVGIPGESMTLREFFDALGITEKDCQKAYCPSKLRT